MAYTMLQRYCIYEQVHNGGFGKIYRGSSRKTGDAVAIKIEVPGGTLKNEVYILNYLHKKKCSDIPPIRWYGAIDAYIALVLPYYACSLEDCLAQPISVHCAVDYFCALLAALLHIHKRFVVHRDIKPANIMLNGSAFVIIDFGLATFYIDADEKHVPTTSPLKSHIVGSSKYASVHVHRGYDPVRRDDVISLVYVLIAMLNGTRCPVPVCTTYETPTELENTHILHPINRYYCDKKSDIYQFPECVGELVSKVYGMSFFEMPDYDTITEIAQHIRDF